MTARRRRAVAVIAALAAASGAAVGCTEVTTDPNTPVAISFDSLPAPSIVARDTLRDPETGAVVPLTAVAYNSSGVAIAGAKFSFFPRDTSGALRVVGGDTLIADTLHASATQPSIIASLNGLQLPQSIVVVPRPDRLEPAAGTDRAFSVFVPDDKSNVVKDSLRVRVVHDTTSADSLVRAWIVHFSVERLPSAIADSARLVSDAGGFSSVDTTDASGIASRNLRVFTKSGTASGAVDTAVVVATARYKGSPLSGSPVRFVIVLGTAAKSAP